MGGFFTQIRPPPPALTEKTLPSQHGKTFLISGDIISGPGAGAHRVSARTSHSRSGRSSGSGGVVFELATILYYAGAHVWITSASEDRVREAIDDIKNLRPTEPSFGRLDYILLDLCDLTTISHGADEFLARQSKLHGLFHHASPAVRPSGTRSAQGHDIHLARNVLGPLLLTKCLLPALRATALNLPNARVRVVFTMAISVDTAAPKGGMDLEAMGIGLREPEQVSSPMTASHSSISIAPQSAAGSTFTPTSKQYLAASSVGAWFLATTLGRALSTQGILCVAANPGNLNTDLIRHRSWAAQRCVAPFLYPPVFGACSLLWAGLSDGLSMDHVGAYIIPWGRLHPSPRKDLLRAMEPTLRQVGDADRPWPTKVANDSTLSIQGGTERSGKRSISLGGSYSGSGSYGGSGSSSYPSSSSYGGGSSSYDSSFHPAAAFHAHTHAHPAAYTRDRHDHSTAGRFHAWCESVVDGYVPVVEVGRFK